MVSMALRSRNKCPAKVLCYGPMYGAYYCHSDKDGSRSPVPGACLCCATAQIAKTPAKL